MPLWFVIVERFTPVLVSVRVTLALATTAPEASVTVPSSVALTACEKAVPALNAASKIIVQIEHRPCITTLQTGYSTA